MKFPNLVFAISLRRRAHYEIADAAGLSPSRFSRLLNGRGEFAPDERIRVAEVLAFDEAWLFERVTPRRSANPETAPAMAFEALRR